MPRFRITDPTTGKAVVVSGETAPTDQDADQIFADAGLRQLSGGGQTGVPPVAPKNMDAWFASQIGQPAQLAPPGTDAFPDQPQALQPPPPDTATDVLRSSESGLTKIPGLTLGFGGDVGSFEKDPADYQTAWPWAHRMAKTINPANVLPRSSTLNDAVAQQLTRMRNAAPGSSLGRLSAQYGPTTDEGKSYESQTPYGGYAETTATMAGAGWAPGTWLQRGARVVVPAVTSEAARTLPGVKGTALEPWAATIGAVLGGAGVGTAEGVAARRANPVPTTEERFTEAGNEYRQFGGTPVALNQQFMDALQGPFGEQAIQTALRGADANRRTALMAEFNSLLGPTPPTHVSANAVESIRRAFGTMARQVARGTEPDANVEAGLYGRQADVDHVLAQVPEIQNARRVWGMAERSHLIDEAMTAATRSYGTPAGYGDMAQAIRREFKALVRSRDFETFTAPEQQALQSVANGTFTANTLQQLGKFSPIRSHLTRLLQLFTTTGGTAAGFHFGGAEGGLIGALPTMGLAAGGELARQGSNIATARAVQRASELVRSGGVPRPSIAGPALRQGFTAGILTDRNRPLDQSYAARVNALAAP